MVLAQAAKVQAVEEETKTAKLSHALFSAPVVSGQAAAAERTWSLAELQAEQPPQGVRHEAKEESLSEDAFKEVFGIDKQQFRALPGWKRTLMKRKHLLF